jgi:hypothetical protein
VRPASLRYHPKDTQRPSQPHAAWTAFRQVQGTLRSLTKLGFGRRFGSPMLESPSLQIPGGYPAPTVTKEPAEIADDLSSLVNPKLTLSSDGRPRRLEDPDVRAELRAFRKILDEEVASLPPSARAEVIANVLAAVLPTSGVVEDWQVGYALLLLGHGVALPWRVGSQLVERMANLGASSVEYQEERDPVLRLVFRQVPDRYEAVHLMANIVAKFLSRTAADFEEHRKEGATLTGLVEFLRVRCVIPHMPRSRIHEVFAHPLVSEVVGRYLSSMLGAAPLAELLNEAHLCGAIHVLSAPEFHHAVYEQVLRLAKSVITFPISVDHGDIDPRLTRFVELCAMLSPVGLGDSAAETVGERPSGELPKGGASLSETRRPPS